MILLAPMEGLLDFSLRDMLTRVGGIDRCVSEFIRVTDRVLPERVFTRVMPELLNGSRTPAGVPVRAQLLGSDPAVLADNAAALAQLQPAGIDLNFGCPAKTVNRHRGGAVLLDEPELVHDIVVAVRRAVPPAMPVSAKMRLGNQDRSRMVENAQAIEAAGAGELVVHARTKAEGYRPPAYWAQIATIRESVALPVIANGEIWTVDDALRCRAESGCDALMLGRGMVADPGLALAIRQQAATLPGSVAFDVPTPGAMAAGAVAGGPVMAPVDWPQLQPLLRLYWRRIAGHVDPRHRAGRVKQWLNLLRRRFPAAQALYDTVRTVNDSQDFEALLFRTAPAFPDGEASPHDPGEALFEPDLDEATC